MLYGKKGLSDLISIVLLIGLVIALASFVILWSTNLFQKTSDDANLAAAKLLTCSRDVELSILKVCYDSQIHIDIENKRDRQIDGNFILFRVEGDDSILVQPSPPGTNLLPFDKRRISLTYFPEVGSLRKVALIPRVLTDQGYIFCTDKIVESSFISSDCSN